MSPRALLAVGLSICTAGLPVPAAAGVRVQLVDLSPPGPSAAARQQVLAGLAKGLGLRGSWEVRFDPPAERASSGTKLKELLAKAQSASAQFREEEALRLLQEADRLFREGYGAELSVEPLVEILLAQAKLEAETGHTDRGGLALTRVAVLDPKRTLDPGRFAPLLVQLFERLKARVARETGSILVSTVPAGQPVYVDGLHRGQTPLTLTLAAGEHFVAVGAAGATSGRAATVTQGQRSEVLLAAAAPQPASDGALRALGRQRAAAWVVAVSVETTGQGWRVTVRPLATQATSTAEPLRIAVGSEEKLGWAASELSGTLAYALQRGTGTAGGGGGDDRPPRRRSILAAWWFWTGVAVVVGGAAAATGVVLSRPEPLVHLRLTR